MNKTDFLNEVLNQASWVLASTYLRRQDAAAFESPEHYQEFKDLVIQEIGPVEGISVVGTGNWQYSLNPTKNFKAFDSRSDIDVAIISAARFNATWEELRNVHRSTWGQIDQLAKERLRRNGENVYGGFVTPAYIPGAKNSHRFEYQTMLNRLSNKSPGRRDVKMLYFKNETEAIDYYRRGFDIAKRSLK